VRMAAEMTGNDVIRKVWRYNIGKENIWSRFFALKCCETDREKRCELLLKNLFILHLEVKIKIVVEWKSIEELGSKGG
jgi:hypothetical protein